MEKRDFGEMVAFFNRKVAEMDIPQKYKMELLGMITAIKMKHDELVPKWIPCSERLPDWDEHRDEMVLVCYGNGSIRFDTCMNGEWVHGNPIAWMPLPEPWGGDR